MIHTTKTKTTVIYNDFDIFKTKFKVCNVQLGQATNIQLSFVLETKIPKKLDTFRKKIYLDLNFKTICANIF